MLNKLSLENKFINQV